MRTAGRPPSHPGTSRTGAHPVSGPVAAHSQSRCDIRPHGRATRPSRSVRPGRAGHCRRGRIPDGPLPEGNTGRACVGIRQPIPPHLISRPCWTLTRFACLDRSGQPCWVVRSSGSPISEHHLREVFVYMNKKVWLAVELRNEYDPPRVAATATDPSPFDSSTSRAGVRRGDRVCRSRQRRVQHQRRRTVRLPAGVGDRGSECDGRAGPIPFREVGAGHGPHASGDGAGAGEYSGAACVLGTGRNRRDGNRSRRSGGRGDRLEAVVRSTPHRGRGHHRHRVDAPVRQ